MLIILVQRLHNIITYVGCNSSLRRCPELSKQGEIPPKFFVLNIGRPFLLVFFFIESEIYSLEKQTNF